MTGKASWNKILDLGLLKTLWDFLLKLTYRTDQNGPSLNLNKIWFRVIDNLEQKLFQRHFFKVTGYLAITNLI
jgi:hypothetical protein